MKQSINKPIEEYIDIFDDNNNLAENNKERIYKNAIDSARNLMYKQTLKNKAPSWLLTCLAQEVGEELAEEFGVDKNIVLLTLYLQHLLFDPITNGEIQKNHPNLSADYIVNNKLLENWNIPEEDREIILEAIRSHHKKEINPRLIVEVIKNAECQKFVTIKGILIWLHELGLRGYDYEKSKELVFYKMNQKKSLLTLKECVDRGNKSCDEIMSMFENKTIEQELIKLHKFGLDKIPYDEAIKQINL